MNRWHYYYAGLRVTSEVELPEWHIFESADWHDDAEVTIRVDRQAWSEHAPGITPDRYSLHIEGIADYCVRGGREIIISPQPDAGAREIRLFLLGSAWGALCYQRGILVLHAGVVQHGGRAIAFCGPSGAGKSSIVAWLVAHGDRFVADDLCRFDMEGDVPCVYPAAPHLKLWRDALTNLSWSEDGWERDHFRMDKFRLPLLRDREDARLRLSAIYLLEWGEPHVLRLTGIAALRQFVESATYRGELLEPLDLVAAHWQRCANLAQRVPIFQFVRRSDWATMDAGMARLLEHWRSAF